jgi:hypothetical protein
MTSNLLLYGESELNILLFPSRTAVITYDMTCVSTDPEIVLLVSER